nr:retrovirus-related Pol polyprotein from transposon TNT 1-94 [Tanacetum cinerariifolium]
MPKGIKQSPLEKVLLKSAKKYMLFLKGCTWLKFKFEGDSTSVLIQPSCHSTSKEFQDSLDDDEEDTRSSHEYLNDLEGEYQAKDLLAKSKRFFNKGTQRFSSAKETDQIKCHKYSKKGHFARDCWSKTLDEEEVSSYDKETKVKALMALTDEERIFDGKESDKNGEWAKITIKSQLTEDTSSCGSKDLVFVKSSTDNSDMSITSNNLHKSSEAEDSTLPNHDTDEVPSNKSQRNTTDPSAVVSKFLAHDYDLANESSVCSTLLLLLKKLDGAEPCSRPKNVKSILKSKSTFKVETLKGITLNEPSSAPAKEEELILEILNMSQKNYETCGSSVHTISDHNDIEWFRKRETPHAKKAESSNALRSKTPTKSEYVAPPSIDVVRKWFSMLGYGEEVSTKGTLRKSLFPLSIANGIHIDYTNFFWEDIILKLKKKQREKVVFYTRFLSLLIMHKMKEDYGTYKVTLYPTQIFSVNNWALKLNQPQEPSFTDHILAICALDKPVITPP